MKNMKNMKSLKKKGILLLVAMLALLCIALFFQNDVQDDEAEQSTQSAEDSTESAELPAESVSPGPVPVYEDGKFTFTAGQFREHFADTLPEGYIFADTMAANFQQNGKMQLEILDETGEPTDIAILFNVEKTDLACSQMALIIKEDGYQEDVAAMLEWYLSTFLDSFEPGEKASIYEEYLDMLDSRAENYRLYTTDFQAVLMNRMEEDTGKYYYVMISIQ